MTVTKTWKYFTKFFNIKFNQNWFTHFPGILCQWTGRDLNRCSKGM